MRGFGRLTVITRRSWESIGMPLPFRKRTMAAAPWSRYLRSDCKVTVDGVRMKVSSRCLRAAGKCWVPEDSKGIQRRVVGSVGTNLDNINREHRRHGRSQRWRPSSLSINPTGSRWYEIATSFTSRTEAACLQSY